MTESTAEDPWAGFTGQSAADAADAELIDPILKALGESRARFGDMEQRFERERQLNVEALFIIDALGGMPGDEWQARRDALKREWQAEALEQAADAIQALHPGERKNSVEWLRGRAAALRNGGNTEGTDR